MPGKGPRKYGSASIPAPKPTTSRVKKVWDKLGESTDFPTPPPLKRAPAAPRVLAEPRVKVHLQLAHTVNGVAYGPGPVTVTRNQANMFLNTEAECGSKELSLVQQQAFIIKMGPRGPIKVQVPWAQFDAILGRQELPMESIHDSTGRVS